MRKQTIGSILEKIVNIFSKPDKIEDVETYLEPCDMSRYRFILVKPDDYNRYLKKFKHNRLGKWDRIYTHNKATKIVDYLDSTYIEVDYNGIETDYELIDERRYHDGDCDYIITFDNLTFELISDGESYHIYTNSELFGDINEIAGKLYWTLCDIGVGGEICIGPSGSNNDVLYEHMMKYISNWEKRGCKVYEYGWAIFFNV